MYYCYIILCADNSLYTGVTCNPSRRFAEHNNQAGGRYTKMNTAKELMYTEEFKTKRDALKRERQIKGWTRLKKMNLIIYGNPKPR